MFQKITRFLARSVASGPRQSAEERFVEVVPGPDSRTKKSVPLGPISSANRPNPNRHGPESMTLKGALDLLGLNHGTTMDQLRRAYRSLLASLDPHSPRDRAPEINAAYQRVRKHLS